MNNLDFLVQQPYTPADVFRFGVVTGLSPLRVKLDGDANPAPVTPIVTCEVSTGDRVFVQIHNRQLMVVGRVGGLASLPRLRLTATDDASETSTGHAFQIGPDNGVNLIIDGNEVLGRNNGALSPIFIGCGIGSLPAPAGGSYATNKDYVDKRVLTGSITITPSAANTPTSANITFPAGRFTAAPTVMVTPSTTVPGSTVTGWAATGATATGATLWVTRTNTTNTLLNWVAFSND